MTFFCKLVITVVVKVTVVVTVVKEIVIVAMHLLIPAEVVVVKISACNK